MLAQIHRPSFYLALTLVFSAAWGPAGWAAGIYTVTDLGSVNPVNQASTLPQQNEAQALHPMLGLSLTDAERGALPWVHGIRFGVTYPTYNSVQMTPYQSTDSGIVIGAVPEGYDYAFPLANLRYVYVQKQADGTFGPLMPLATQFTAHGAGFDDSFASLDAKGNILLTNRSVQQLIDVNTGTKTDLATLLPPGTLDRPGFSGTISYSKMAADGTIFAAIKSADFANGPDTHLFMMTPVPEPSTLATFAVLVAGLAVARGRSKRGIEPSTLSGK